MLYTKLPTSAIDFDDSVNGGVYGKYRPVSAYFWQCAPNRPVEPPTCLQLMLDSCMHWEYTDSNISCKHVLPYLVVLYSVGSTGPSRPSRLSEGWFTSTYTNACCAISMLLCTNIIFFQCGRNARKRCELGLGNSVSVHVV